LEGFLDHSIAKGTADRFEAQCGRARYSMDFSSR